MTNTTNERKIILDLAVTLDGLIEGPNGETDWCIMELDMGFPDFLDTIDTILYGRKSYELWGQYTPEENVSKTEQDLWDKIHSKEKIVFSKTKQATNGPVTLIHDHIVEEVQALKNKPGKNIWLYGGSSLITTFVNLGLVDEYRLSVHPIILGSGKPLFTDIKQRVNLQIVDTRTFSSGVVQMIYHSK